MGLIQVLEISLVINCDGLQAAKTSLDDLFVIFMEIFTTFLTLLLVRRQLYRAKF